MIEGGEIVSMKRDIKKIILFVVIICFFLNFIWFLLAHGAFPHLAMIIRYMDTKNELIKMVHKEVGFDIDIVNQYTEETENGNKIPVYWFNIEDTENEMLVQDIVKACNHYLEHGKSYEPFKIIFCYYEPGAYTPFATISNVYSGLHSVYAEDKRIQYLSIYNVFEQFLEGDTVYRTGTAFQNLTGIRYLKLDMDAWEGFSNQEINWYEMFPELESFIVTETDYDNGETIYYRAESDGTLKKLLNDDSLLSYCSYDVQDMFESGELPVAVRHETDGESGKVCYETTERQMITDIMDAFRRIHVLNQMESSSYQEPNNLILVMADGRTYTIRFNQFYFAGNQEDELQKYNLEECNDFWDLIWDVLDTEKYVVGIFPTT